MPKRNRITLKECFKQGKKPQELDFENLIDSAVNIIDDGFSKSPDTGIALAPIMGKNNVLSILRNAGDDKPAWSVAIDPDSGDLKIGRYDQTDGVSPLVTLRHEGGVEIGGSVKLLGTLSCSMRQGSYLTGEVPADGSWYDITPDLEGCWALEVVAGCGQRGAGKYALLVAVAMHCFGEGRRISKTSSHYGMRGNRIVLRWVHDGLKCRLQAKTVFMYDDDIMINYNISKLWDAPMMMKP